MREWLTRRRHELKLTQRDIAIEVGISRSAYSNIELGARRPSVQVAKNIGNLIDIDWTLFFEDDCPEMKRKSNSA
ncbi:helix-turn-helix domain-containing protein [Priestia filamentosa]|uniref:helix-turn-helix transcriptional regulator n=1 Tax=Priestia filamentosa TaxID=1402861 RepID=UPI003F14A9DC